MRLSSIKLSGFKSFVDPTALPLPSNLTAVVGPNGCGKSNIIDAVRWLLGETSMKELRSGAMEDVIFNGCKTRKPAGRAMVELLFDNSDGAIAGPYAAYSEISIRREYTRDGDSQYFLNGSKCLKRDVTDLFLGTGVAARSGYAIIEQGMVSRMITAKPEELRMWLEEAAGISKYKERRRETESRIKQTRENLARLNDLRSELVARLETLKKQAVNAEKYKEYKEQERVLKGELLGLRLRALESQGAVHQTAIAELTRGIEAVRARVTESQTAQTEAEAALNLSNQQLSDQQGRVYESEAAASRLEQNLTHARDLKAIKVRDLEQMTRQIEEIAQRETREKARQLELTDALARQETEAQAGEQMEAKARETMAQAESLALKEENRWMEFAQRAEQPLVQTESERVRVEQLQRGLQQTEARLIKLRQEKSALDDAAIQSTLFNADAELQQVNRDISESQTRLRELDRQLQELRDARSTGEGALHEARQALQNARGRLSSLETLQQAALRQDDSELGGWLKQNNMSEAPRLASVIHVDAGWMQAVEQVLDEWLQAPLLPELAASLSTGPKSGIGLVQQTPPVTQGKAGRLSAKVQGPAVVSEWLANIHVVTTAAQAQQLAQTLPAGESVITPDGVWRGRHWVRYPRQAEEQSGVLARGLLLKQLRVESETQTEAVRTREKAVADLRTHMQSLESERQTVAARFETARGAQAQKLAFRQEQAVRLEQVQARIQQLGQELQTIQTLEQEQSRERAEAQARLQALEEAEQKLREEQAALQQTLAQVRAGLQQAREKLTQVQNQRQQTLVELAGRRSALEALHQSLADLANRAQQLLAQKTAYETEAQALDAPLQSQATALESARAAVQASREELRHARERVTAAETRQSEVIQKLRQAEFDHDLAREKLQQAQLEFQSTDVRRQTFDDQIRDSGFAREDLLKTLEPDATPENWEEKLATMARRIERLGLINLAAIQELEESSSRDAELMKQHDDIVGALATLEEAIKKIDGETKDRFKITFDKVDETFRRRFPQLFGGGEAYLELTGDNILETGVRVMARPPGKRNSSIQLLSGGEKTMTAVALLLALFELNPAPFCMLDEVDAALDDANVARFVAVVRDMSSSVQFIIITHNKITMELAQQLHGVTMQEAGVSRLVSVDVEQAVELAGKKEEATA
ncbi:MAG: chromosome segregation protein SMC [Pseudomonadota bacterium]